MSERPPVLAFAAGHVLQAVSVKVLAAGLKDVWHVVHRFDHSVRGCYLTALQIAGKIGMSEATVYTYLAELRQLGLLVRLSSGWTVALPPDCRPCVARPGDAEVLACARRLEGYLVGSGSTPSRTPVRVAVGPASDGDSDPGPSQVGFPSETARAAESDPGPRIPAQTRRKSVGPPSDASGRRRSTAVGVDLEIKTPTAVGVGAHAHEQRHQEQRRAAQGLAALAPADREQLLAADPALRRAVEAIERKRRAAS